MEINIEKKHFYGILGLIILITSGIIIYANVDTSKPWHDASSIQVTINGQQMSLQEALENDLFTAQSEGESSTNITKCQSIMNLSGCQITSPGTFQEGNYIFPSNSKVGIGIFYSNAQLSIAQNAKIDGKLDVSRDVNIKKRLNVNENAKIDGRLDVSRLDVRGNTKIDGNTEIDGKLDVRDVTINGELDVRGNIIADNPTKPKHVATKNYVDSKIIKWGDCRFISMEDNTANCPRNYFLVSIDKEKVKCCSIIIE